MGHSLSSLVAVSSAGMTGPPAFSIAAALGKAAPVYGQVLSGISLGIELVKTYQAQSACVNSGKYD
jgi:hypothetical protein